MWRRYGSGPDRALIAVTLAELAQDLRNRGGAWGIELQYFPL